MDDRPTSPSFWRRFPWLFGILPLLAVLGFLAYRAVLDRKVEARLAAIRQAGLPASCEDLNAWYQWPAGENAADLYAQAFAWYQEWPEEKRKLLPIMGEAEMPGRTVALSNDVVVLIADYLSDNDKSVGLLHAAAAVQSCRYPVDLRQGFAALLPHLSKLRQGARLLSLEGILAAEHGDPERACRAVEDGLAVADSLLEEPVLISQLVRFACQDLALTGLERILNCARLSESELNRLARAVAGSEGPAAVARAYAGEQCLGSDLFDMPISELSGVALQSPSPSLGLLCVLGLYRATGLMDLEHLTYLSTMEDLRRASEAPLPGRLELAARWKDQLDQRPRYQIISNLLLPAGDRAIVREARAVARLRVAAVTLAIERYRLDHGESPPEISALVPAFLPAIPADPFDGQPLRYRELPAGSVVYSLGEDLTDDGGREKDAQGRPYQPGTDISFTVER